MNNGTSFHFHFKPDRNKSPSKKENQLDKQRSNPHPSDEQSGPIYIIFTESTPVCYKSVYYKHI